MSHKVIIVFGTRPEAIKLAPLIRELNDRKTFFDIRVCVTAQHREMLDPLLDLFDIGIDHDLDIMRPDQDLFDISLAVLDGLRSVLSRERPEMVVVQGDTSTTFLGALSGHYLRIPVAHVEAGLRSGDKFQPFPEEMNRRMTDALSDLHFCPTDEGRDNLIREGVAPEGVHVTGNTAVDALLWVSRRQADPKLEETLKSEFASRLGIEFGDCRTVLVTAHRRESFGAGLDNICRAILRLVRERSDIQVVFPVHLNPRVRETVDRRLAGEKRIRLIDPLEYDRFVYLMNRSDLILSDSGGIQEEAPSLGKPLLVLREVTERPEGVAAGAARLTGTSADGIFKSAEALLEDQTLYRRMARAVNPYGDGRAAARIAEIMQDALER